MTVSPPPGRCPRCWLQPRYCLCDTLPVLSTVPGFVIVRHHKEALKPTNSARIAALCLPQAKILDYGARGTRFDREPLRGPDTWLLFPPEEGAPAQAPPATTPDTLVVLDGTWSQVRRLSHRISELRELPRFTLPGSPTPRLRLRNPHAPWAMATMEAMARALDFFGEVEAGAALMATYDRYVAQVRLQRGVRPRSTRESSDRADEAPPSGGW